MPSSDLRKRDERFDTKIQTHATLPAELLIKTDMDVLWSIRVVAYIVGLDETFTHSSGNLLWRDGHHHDHHRQPPSSVVLTAGGQKSSPLSLH